MTRVAQPTYIIKHRLLKVYHMFIPTRSSEKCVRNSKLILSRITKNCLRMHSTSKSLLSGLAVALCLIIQATATSEKNAGSSNTITETDKLVVKRADSTSYTSDASFKQQMLASHNFFRVQHSAKALMWNDARASASATYSKKCVFKHSVSLHSKLCIVHGF